MAASFEDRKRFAEKAKISVRAYWLTQTRYMQQVGDDSPRVVEAAPSMPAKVLLPHGKKIKRTKNVMDKASGKVSEVEWEHDEHKEDPFLKLIVDEADPPAKPIEAHLPPKKAEPMKAHKKFGAES
jgi:hypothetical protein